MAKVVSKIVRGTPPAGYASVGVVTEIAMVATAQGARLAWRMAQPCKNRVWAWQFYGPRQGRAKAAELGLA